MIQIKKIKPPKIKLYNSKGTCLGLLNEYEFLDARVQIKEQKLEGYSAIFNQQVIWIDKNGELSDYPEGMFDQLTKLYLKLV